MNLPVQIQCRFRRVPAIAANAISMLILVATGCAGANAQHRMSSPELSKGAAPIESPEAAIEETIRVWYEAISERQRRDPAVELSFAKDGFTAVLFGDRITGDFELHEWQERLGRVYSSIDHAIASIDVEIDRPGHYRARVDVTREAIDRDGLVHISRRAQIWSVRRSQTGSDEIVRVTEDVLIPHSGTGPQVMCF